LLARAAADVWHRLAHADDRLARLAVREGWLDGAFDKGFDALGSHPRARMAPDAPPLPEALDALFDAAACLGDALDDDLAARLADVDWYAKSPLKGRTDNEIVAALRTAAADPCGDAA